MPSHLTSGRLDAKLSISFTQPPKGTPALVLSGKAGLRKVAAEFGGKPVLTCERFEAVLASLDVFGRKARLTSLEIVAPEVWVRRDERTVHPRLEAFVAPAAKRPGKAAEERKDLKTPAGFPLIEVARIGIERGTLHQEDASFSRRSEPTCGTSRSWSRAF
jgi:hypothetical protein